MDLLSGLTYGQAVFRLFYSRETLLDCRAKLQDNRRARKLCAVRGVVRPASHRETLLGVAIAHGRGVGLSLDPANHHPGQKYNGITNDTTLHLFTTIRFYAGRCNDLASLGGGNQRPTRSSWFSRPRNTAYQHCFAICARRILQWSAH